MKAVQVERNHLLSRTEAKKKMRQRIIEISMSCWGAMWAPGIEYVLWEMMLSKTKGDFFAVGFGYVFSEEIRELAELVNNTRCWCTEHDFVAVDSWKKTFAMARATHWEGIPSGSIALSPEIRTTG